MKDGCNVIDKKDMIVKCEIVEEKIVVYYGDGRTEEECNTKKNIIRLKGEMLKQAVIRDQKMYKEALPAEERKNVSNDINTRFDKIRAQLSFYGVNGFIFFGGMEALSTYYVLSGANIDTVTEYPFMALTATGLACTTAFVATSKKRLNELKKYHIYLENRIALEKYKGNVALYDGVKTKEELDIDTIDNFSLRKVKKIAKNLKHIGD